MLVNSLGDGQSSCSSCFEGSLGFRLLSRTGSFSFEVTGKGNSLEDVRVNNCAFYPKEEETGLVNHLSKSDEIN